jgi:hypothetical protein
MKKTCLALALFAVSGWNSLRAQTIVDFDSIQYWVGTGSNRAALIIDWKNTSTPNSSFAWGFRWDGQATGYEMISAIAGNVGLDPAPAVPDGTGDPALTIYAVDFGFGLAVSAIGYQIGATTLFERGFNPDTPGFFAYFLADGSTALPTTWTSSMVGSSDRLLSNNSWDAWVWAPNFVESLPDTPLAAIPEPGAILLILASAAGIWLISIRRRRQARG